MSDDKPPLAGGEAPPNTTPKKEIYMNKNKRVTIRLTEDEYKNFTKQADELAISLSEFIRLKLNNINKIKTSKCDKNLVYEINRIGLNLNQIAKYTNSRKIVDKLVLEQLIAIEKQLNKVLKEM